MFTGSSDKFFQYLKSIRLRKSKLTTPSLPSANPPLLEKGGETDKQTSALKSPLPEYSLGKRWRECEAFETERLELEIR